MANTSTAERPFLGRIPRPRAVEKMIRETEREVALLRVMLDASRKMESVSDKQSETADSA